MTIAVPSLTHMTPGWGGVITAEPIWMTVTMAQVIHDDQLAAHGGARGLRDQGLLLSALARVQHRYEYKATDLHRLAADYGYGIARNHPFVDGNITGSVSGDVCVSQDKWLGAKCTGAGGGVGDAATAIWRVIGRAVVTVAARAKSAFGMRHTVESESLGSSVVCFFNQTDRKNLNQ
jgi:hypothetical protein